MTKAAISISAYNRPEYLKQVVESLEKNPESSFLDFYFFLDGGQESTQEENAKIITSSSIVNKHIIARDNNWGVGRNMIDARRTLFDVCGYDRVLVLEDDMVLSLHYIGLVFRLLDWAEANFDNVGMVQGWFPCTWNPEKKASNLQAVCVTFAHFWGYALSRKVWNEMKQLLYEYEERFLKNIPSYKSRNHKLIRNFFNKVAQKEWLNESINKWPENLDIRSAYLSNTIGTGQDAATGLSLWSSGYCKLAMIVNRGLAIGKVGEHFREGLFKKMGLDSVILDIFEEDANISSFYPTNKEGKRLGEFQQNALSTSNKNKNETKLKATFPKNIFTAAKQLKQQGRLEDAITTYHQAISRNPNFAWTYYALAETLTEAGRVNEALETYSRAIKLNPNSAFLHYRLGMALARHGKVNDAVLMLEKAMKLNPLLLYKKEIVKDYMS